MNSCCLRTNDLYYNEEHKTWLHRQRCASHTPFTNQNQFYRRWTLCVHTPGDVDALTVHREKYREKDKGTKAPHFTDTIWSNSYWEHITALPSKEFFPQSTKGSKFEKGRFYSGNSGRPCLWSASQWFIRFLIYMCEAGDGRICSRVQCDLLHVWCALVVVVHLASFAPLHYELQYSQDFTTTGATR